MFNNRLNMNRILFFRITQTHIIFFNTQCQMEDTVKLCMAQRLLAAANAQPVPGQLEPNQNILTVFSRIIVAI